MEYFMHSDHYNPFVTPWKTYTHKTLHIVFHGVVPIQDTTCCRPRRTTWNTAAYTREGRGYNIPHALHHAWCAPCTATIMTLGLHHGDPWVIPCEPLRNKTLHVVVHGLDHGQHPTFHGALHGGRCGWQHESHHGLNDGLFFQ